MLIGGLASQSLLDKCSASRVGATCRGPGSGPRVWTCVPGSSL